MLWMTILNRLTYLAVLPYTLFLQTVAVEGVAGSGGLPLDETHLQREVALILRHLSWSFWKLRLLKQEMSGLLPLPAFFRG